MADQFKTMRRAQVPDVSELLVMARDAKGPTAEHREALRKRIEREIFRRMTDRRKHMRSTLEATVQRIVAEHTRRPLSEVRLGSHLERDLGVLPLDLVAVALTLEDEERFRFPFDRLVSVRTVRDLIHLVRTHDGQNATASLDGVLRV